MKNLNKISVLLILLLGLTFTSCETTDLDLINDPNQITVDNGDLERYMVAIQVDFARFASAMGSNGARLVRIEQMSAGSYVNAFEPIFTNYEWRLAYVNLFSDIQNAHNLATEKGSRGNHIAVMKILQAYTLISLVDYFGDIPWIEATNLGDYPQPNLDSGSSVYAAAITMLTDAGQELGLLGNLNLANDYYYNNNFDQWQKLANTLLMQAYVNTNNTSAFNALVNGNNFISETADDFVWEYTALINDEIDARAPGYQSDYTAGGVTSYKSDYLMNAMLKDPAGEDGKGDPRRRYYFFRQNECTPGALKDFTLPADAAGNQCPVDPERLFCSTSPRPAHYPGSEMVYCSVDNGYWGRDHGFGGGIPPDTFKRTAYGVYPYAGNFDDNRFSSVGLGQGGGGAGITPIYLASWSHLMLAEMALTNGGDAAFHLKNALEISIAKVMSFGSLDGDIQDTSYIPTSAYVTTYITNKLTEFNNLGADKMEVLGEQHLVAHFGNGSNSYNFYRRTGYPRTLQWTVEPAPGGFVRSLFYPADEANTNPNVPQKPNVGVQVFWDDNPPSSAAGTGYPYAN